MPSRYDQHNQLLPLQRDRYAIQELHSRELNDFHNIEEYRNAIVDGSEDHEYEIYNNGQSITIQSRTGRTYNDNTNRNWDVIAAAAIDNGFAVLRAGTSPHRFGQYRIWLTDEDGVITSNVRWQSGEDLRHQGYEDIFDLDLDNDGQIGKTIEDEDRNGIVDGSEKFSYEIYNNGQSITIQTRTGRTYNDNTNSNWNVIAAAEINNGFAVLRAGTSPHRFGQYRIWLTDEDGVITSNVRWQSGEDLRHQGYEDIFDLDLDNDGQIGKTIEDEDRNGIVDGSEKFSYEIYNNGQSITIQTRTGRTYNDNTNSNWNVIAAAEINNGFAVLRAGTSPHRFGQYRIWLTDEDGVITSNVRWQSGEDLRHQGYEDIFDLDLDNDGQIGDPAPDTTDDYDNTTNTNGYLEVGSTAEGILEVTGDRDWLRINLVEGKIYNFTIQGQTLDDSYLRFYDSIGNLIEENDDYDGLNSSINNYRARITGDYYLGVGAYADTGTGSYVLSAYEVPLPPAGYNSDNGYGQINIQRAFEQHLNITLAAVEDLEGNHWTLDNIYAPEVWSQNGDFAGATGLGTVVAVIDTGVDLDHREFSGRIIQGYDFVDDDLFADDGNGHGTHVAGTIAGAYDNFGVTGVAHDSEIMPIRVLDNNGTGYTSDIISGIRFAADNNADVINLSLGGGGYSQSMADAIEYAANLGSLVVMAAGNSGGTSPEYPAAHAVNHGLAVGAVDQYGNLANFSNLAGSTVIDYVTAPGVDVYSSIPGDSYTFYSGTSMATPHVAGAAALLRGYDRNLTAETIEDLLTGTASNNAKNSSINHISRTNTTLDEIIYHDGYITAETISNFNPNELSGTFIGRASDTFQASSLREIDDFPFLPNNDFESLTSNLYALNLDGSTNNYTYMTELLNGNQFDYFEIDRSWTIA